MVCVASLFAVELYCPILRPTSKGANCGAVRLRRPLCLPISFGFAFWRFDFASFGWVAIVCDLAGGVAIPAPIGIAPIGLPTALLAASLWHVIDGFHDLLGPHAHFNVSPVVNNVMEDFGHGPCTTVCQLGDTA